MYLLASYCALVHNQQAKGKAWEVILENKMAHILPRSVFTASFFLIAGHDYLQWHLDSIGIKDSPLCSLCGDVEGMDLDRIQRCQSVTYDVVNTNNLDTWLKFSKLNWTARNTRQTIYVTFRRDRNTIVVMEKQWVLHIVCACVRACVMSSVTPPPNFSTLS